MYKFRKTITILWFIFIAFCLGFYLLEHDRFTPEAIKLFLDQFGTKAKWIYFLFGLVRGFTFLPTTVMAIGGGALFPENPWLVFAMCMIGVMVSRTIIYFFSDWLGADDFFKNKYQSKIDWLEKNLQKYGMPVIIGWAMFPFVPTDLLRSRNIQDEVLEIDWRNSDHCAVRLFWR